MEVLTPVEQHKVLSVFMTALFGGRSGYVCISHMKAANRNTWKDEFYSYPEEQSTIIERISQLTVGYNVYFSPMLYSARKREKQAVETTPVLWSDLDSCDPDLLLVPPTIVVESSPGRFQAYWVMQDDIDPDDAEDLARRIAYKHANDGADRSGWDLTQVLRVPTTYNYKYGSHDDVPTVKLIELNRKVYRVEDFAEDYPEVAGYEYILTEMPEDIPDADDVLNKHRLTINPAIWKLYNEEPEEDWSKPLWNLQMMLFEAGFSPEEVFAVAIEAKCNKYRRDGRSMHLLWKEVCRAQSRWEINESAMLRGGVDEETRKVELLSAEERQIVLQSKDTFVERYSEWARGLGDAAPQYHQAGAFVALSSIIAGRVRLPTSFGNIIPNLWFMILADTTLTRKTTAMDIAMDLVYDVDPDAVLATDGSIEGLLTAMSLRPGRPSVFLRDEFSGLLEQMTKKDYMAGMAELLTKLYDGKMQKRILRKETVEVREPILILFAGGIKNKVTGILTHEQVSSGFMPRFIFITAESDISRLKPLGPPTQKTINNGDAIRNELIDIYTFYTREKELSIKDLRVSSQVKDYHTAYLEDDAWVRYNQLEHDMLEAGLNSAQPDIMTPTYDRLSKSILKASVLLAASRMEESPKVTLEDLLKAIHYGEQWKGHADEIMANIGQGTSERLLNYIVETIKRSPGVSRSVLMRNHRLNSREASLIFETLEQRGLIRARKQGRTTCYWAV